MSSDTQTASPAVQKARIVCGAVLGSVLVTAELGAAAILFGVAVGVGVFHFPTRDWLEGEA